jgi:imidazolonepropionase-like amidohydrolase
MAKLQLILALLLLSICSQGQSSKQQNYEFANGQWFDGQKFVAGKFYSVGGRLTAKKPARIDKTFDLTGKFIVPPFAEAHNHNLESEHELQERISKYLSHGVFYVKLQSSIKKRIAPLMSNYNHPLGLDISLTYAPITASGGHPVGIRKSYLEQGLFGNLFKTLDDLESHGFFTIDSEKDLAEKWDSVLAFKPDFIKVMLLYSEEYERRKDEQSYFGRKGLNPKLLPDIVKKAHQAGLRVSVHVETSMDFHNAITSGADEIAHVPGRSNDSKIALVDAKTAAKKNVVVITTAGLVKRRNKDPNYPKFVDAIKHNLKILKDAGVKLAVGSDDYNDTSFGEVTFLAETGVFSNLELLKMWSEASAETTFPNRRIGRLKSGYEASFLVLSGNPIEDFANVQRIEMRVKQGEILSL